MNSNIDEGLNVVVPVFAGAMLVLAVVVLIVAQPIMALAIFSGLAFLFGVSWLVGAWINARK